MHTKKNHFIVYLLSIFMLLGMFVNPGMVVAETEDSGIANGVGTVISGAGYELNYEVEWVWDPTKYTIEKFQKMYNEAFQKDPKKPLDLIMNSGQCLELEPKIKYTVYLNQDNSSQHINPNELKIKIPSYLFKGWDGTTHVQYIKQGDFPLPYEAHLNDENQNSTSDKPIELHILETNDDSEFITISNTDTIFSGYFTFYVGYKITPNLVEVDSQTLSKTKNFQSTIQCKLNDDDMLINENIPMSVTIQNDFKPLTVSYNKYEVENEPFDGYYPGWMPEWGPKPENSDDSFYILWRYDLKANSNSSIPYKYKIDPCIEAGVEVVGAISEKGPGKPIYFIDTLFAQRFELANFKGMALDGWQNVLEGIGLYDQILNEGDFLRNKSTENSSPMFSKEIGPFHLAVLKKYPKSLLNDDSGKPKKKIEVKDKITVTSISKFNKQISKEAEMTKVIDLSKFDGEKTFGELSKTYPEGCSSKSFRTYNYGLGLLQNDKHITLNKMDGFLNYSYVTKFISYPIKSEVSKNRESLIVSPYHAEVLEGDYYLGSSNDTNEKMKDKKNVMASFANQEVTYDSAYFDIELYDAHEIEKNIWIPQQQPNNEKELKVAVYYKKGESSFEKLGDLKAKNKKYYFTKDGTVSSKVDFDNRIKFPAGTTAVKYEYTVDTFQVVFKAFTTVSLYNKTETTKAKIVDLVQNYTRSNKGLVAATASAKTWMNTEDEQSQITKKFTTDNQDVNDSSLFLGNDLKFSTGMHFNTYERKPVNGHDIDSSYEQKVPINFSANLNYDDEVEGVYESVNAHFKDNAIKKAYFYLLLPKGTYIDRSKKDNYIQLNNKIIMYFDNTAIEFIKCDDQSTVVKIPISITDGDFLFNVCEQRFQNSFDLYNNKSNIIENGEIVPVYGALEIVSPNPAPEIWFRKFREEEYNEDDKFKDAIKSIKSHKSGENSKWAFIKNEAKYYGGFDRESNAKMESGIGNEFDKIKDVELGGEYKYKISSKTFPNVTWNNLIIYSELENLEENKWHGTYSNVDLSSLKSMKDPVTNEACKPVVYYTDSSASLKTMIDEANPNFKENEHWTTDRNRFKDIKGLAIDCRKTEKDKTFVLAGEQEFNVDITMKSPKQFPMNLIADSNIDNKDLEIMNAAMIKARQKSANSESNLLFAVDSKMRLQKPLVYIRKDAKLKNSSNVDNGTKEKPVEVKYGDEIDYEIKLKVLNDSVESVTLTDNIQKGLNVNYDEILVDGKKIKKKNELKFDFHKLKKDQVITITVPTKVEPTSSKEVVFENTAKVEVGKDKSYQSNTTYHKWNGKCTLTYEWADENHPKDEKYLPKEKQYSFNDSQKLENISNVEENSKYYVFKGWYLHKTDKNKIDTITMDGDKTVYGKWESKKGKKYTVKKNWSENTPNDKKKEVTITVKNDKGIPNQKLQLNDKNNWQGEIKLFDKVQGNNIKEFIEEIKNKEFDVTYALKDDNTIVITNTYKKTGGSTGGSGSSTGGSSGGTGTPTERILVRFLGEGGFPVVQERWIYPGEKVSRTEIADPIRAGYIFDGWYYYDKDEWKLGRPQGYEYMKEFDFNRPIKASIDIYAKWKKQAVIVPVVDDKKEVPSTSDGDACLFELP